MSSIRQGRIVYVPTLDPQGRNPKTRPAVVVTPDDRIAAGGVVRVVAVTGTFGQAPREVTVELPWDRAGHPRTKLRQPGEAVCSWAFDVAVDELTDTGGFVPDRWLSRILLIVAELEAAPPEPPPPPPPPG